MEIIVSIILIAIGYLLGSVPCGLLITKYAGKGDIRNIGSGNIGATNVLRTGSKKLALITLALDALKGVVAVLLAKYLVPDWAVSLVALAAVVGHIFPVWLQFKGGKGVTTTIAIYWALYWPLGLFASIVWIIIFFMSRISSFSSLSAIILSTVIALFFGNTTMFLMALVTAVLVTYRHKENIIRLMRGEEPSFGNKK
jgi:glycerol-3-phosphate acyltransferase PlsY